MNGITRWLLGAGCGESRTSGFEGEVRRSNADIDSNKDWCDSRKCAIDRCSLEKEYILPPDLKFPGEIQQLNNLPKAKKEFPKLGEVPSQVLQQAIKQLHKGWDYFQKRGFGFPRYKKYRQFKSLLFPQFKVVKSKKT